MSLVEQRAVELLVAAKLKGKKNPIETDAAILAERVRSKWQTANRRGRPKGARSTKGMEINRVPVSIEEVIQTVLPIIERFAGTAIRVVVRNSNDLSAIDSPIFAVLVAAVRTAIPSADVETIGRTVKLVRRKARQQRQKLGCKP